MDFKQIYKLNKSILFLFVSILFIFISGCSNELIEVEEEVVFKEYIVNFTELNMILFPNKLGEYNLTGFDSQNRRELLIWKSLNYRNNNNQKVVVMLTKVKNGSEMEFKEDLERELKYAEIITLETGVKINKLSRDTYFWYTNNYFDLIVLRIDDWKNFSKNSVFNWYINEFIPGENFLGNYSEYESVVEEEDWFDKTKNYFKSFLPEKKKKLTDEELKLFSYFEGICYKNESIFNKTYIDEDDYLMIDCNLITEMKNSESEVIVIQISMPNTFNERVDKFLINYGINHDTYINSEDIYKKRNYNFRFSMLNDIINLRKAIENISSDSYMKHRISRIKLMNNKVMFNPYTSPISKNHIINGDNIFRMNFRFLKSVSESDSIEIVKKLGGKNIACTMTINVCYGEFDIRVLNKTDFDSRIVSIGFAGLEPIWQKSDLKNTPISEMKYCEEPLNCIPVGCSCSCSGGLGFSYEDIVNTEYRKEWYLQNECRPAGVCPMVVCPKVEIGCENNICVVIK